MSCQGAAQFQNINAASTTNFAAFHWVTYRIKFCAGASGEPVTTGLPPTQVGGSYDVDNDADAPNMLHFEYFLAG